MADIVVGKQKETVVLGQPQKHFYQAIGYLKGTLVKRDGTGYLDRQTYYLETQGVLFFLRFLKRSKRMTELLEQYVSEQTEVYLKVYPQYHLRLKKHFFTVVYFWAERPPGFVQNQFLLKGVWQKIPQYKDGGCFSIYRNKANHKSDSCKASHLPMRWDGQKWYSYNLNNKESIPFFYEIIAQFSPLEKIYLHKETLVDEIKMPKKVRISRKGGIGCSKPAITPKEAKNIIKKDVKKMRTPLLRQEAQIDSSKPKPKPIIKPRAEKPIIKSLDKRSFYQ